MVVKMKISCGSATKCILVKVYGRRECKIFLIIPWFADYLRILFQ